MAKQTTNPEIIAWQDKWLAARESERQWTEYRRGIEKSSLSAMEKAGIIPLNKAGLPIATEGGSVDLEKVGITYAIKRDTDEQKLGDLAAANPHIVGSTLRVVYEPAITKLKIDKIVKSGTEFGKELGECFTDTVRNPGFRAL